MKLNKLKDFHMSCKKEYTKILDTFSILFYGFGNKTDILKKMFPKSQIFNMYYYSINDVIFFLNERYNLKCKKMKDFDTYLTKRDLLIFLDFNFKYSNLFSGIKCFKMIFTLERMNMEISEQDMLDLNIIMRDLTTYEDYEVDVLEKEEDKSQGYINVLRNVGKNSRIIFSNLLEYDQSVVEINSLFDKIKLKLMIVKKNKILELLQEFVDHKMIKMNDLHNIQILVDKKYFKMLVEECKKMSS
ncbi:hypothetical protein P3W45_000336 [Vairimorpha bombi]|jgi:origin recognition complex subunit 2